MCNCNQRSGVTGGAAPARRRGAPSPDPAREPFAPGPPIAARTFIEMVYAGATALIAIGPITQTRYRFASSGARLRVDARDAPALAQIPKLRRV